MSAQNRFSEITRPHGWRDRLMGRVLAEENNGQTRHLSIIVVRASHVPATIHAVGVGAY